MDYHYNARPQDHTAGNRRQNLMHNVYSPPAHGSRTQGMPLLTEPCEMYETDAEFQIHSMEREAYGSVLRAFIAQSDLLSWGKEGLITELRKELNVTDIEHGQLLGEINSDETVKRIREWRKVSLESQSGKVTATGIPSSVVCITSPNRKRSSHPSLSQPRKLVSESQPAMPLSVPACLRNKRSFGELGTVRSQAYTHNIQELPKDKGRAVQSQPRKGIQAPDSFNMEQCSDIIQIRATDKLIHEVEKMTYELDPVQVEKAKSLLREHERVILGALEKLADISDDDDSPNPHHYYEEAEGNLHGMLINNLGQGGILHGYPSEVHFQTQSTRSRIPCVNIQSEDDDEAT